MAQDGKVNRVIQFLIFALLTYGRIDFDIKELQDEAAQEKNYKRVAYLQHMADVNKAVLNKIPTQTMKSIL